jgi:hypothetical protein
MAEFQYTEESMAADNPPNKPSDAVTEALSMATSAPPSTGRDVTSSFFQAMGTGEAALRAIPSVEAERARQAEEFGAKQKAEYERLGKYGVDIAESAKKEASAIYGKPEYQMLKMPEFMPSQASVGELITMFTMVNTMAMLAGGGSRNSGMAALASLNGALDGYKKGRQDIYKMEMINFDKNLKSLQQNNEARKIELEKALKEVALNKDVGLAKLKEIELQMKGSQIEQDLRLGRFDSALKKLNMLVKAGVDARNRWDNYQIKQQQMATQREVAMIRAATSGTTGGLKPGAETTKNYVGANVMLSDFSDVAKMMSDPKLQKLISDYRVEAFLSENGGKIISQALETEIPNELRTFLSKIARIRNNEYLRVSGKAVTGAEALRNYNVVPQPGSSPDVIKDRLNGMVTQLQREIAITKRMYPQLPDLSDMTSGNNPFKIDNFTVDTPRDKYEIGKVYEDSNGNRSRYKGNGEWEKVNE